MSIDQSTEIVNACAFCRKDFLVPPQAARSKKAGAANRGLFCSISCSNKHRAIPRLVRQCLTCGNDFSPSTVQVKRGTGVYCSKSCAQRVPIIDRFFDKLGEKTASGCILWVGASLEDGYGVLVRDWPERGNIVASRFSYEYFVGPVPDGLWVLHRCDNPQCVNPVHLFLGTHADNVADMMAKGRHRAGPLESKFTESLVTELRTRHTAGEPMRVLCAEFSERLGVRRSYVWLVLRRKIWKNVP